MRAVIPAGGLGSRFAHLRLGIPKEMLPLGGRPLIEHALAEAAGAGFTEAVVVVSPEKRELRRLLEAGSFPLAVSVVEQPAPLGIGDAVLRAGVDGAAGVLLPDDVVPSSEHWQSLRAAYEADGAAALCVRRVDRSEAHRFGIAVCSGSRVVRLVEKPSGEPPSDLAIFGRYIVTEAVLDGLRAWRGSGELQLTYGLAAALAAPPGVRAVRFEAEFFDCGTPDEYERSQARWAARELG